MKLIFLVAAFPLSLFAQTYTTTSQAPNYTGSKAFVNPVVTKTYNLSSPGYKPAASASYNNYKYTSTSTIPNGESAYTTSDPNPLGSSTNPGIYKENGKYGISDMFGHRKTNPVFDRIEAFSWTQRDKYATGFFMIKAGNKWGLQYSESSTPVIPVEYDQMRKINDYTVWVKKDGKVGLLDFRTVDNFTAAIPVLYDEIGSINETYLSMIYVKKGDKVGLLDPLYAPILPEEYQDIREFSNGAILLKKNDKYGLTNRAGFIVLPIEYESISALSDNTAWILKDGKWGMVNSLGRVIITPKYDAVYEQAGGLVWYKDRAVVSKGEKKIYINRSGSEIFSDAAGMEAVPQQIKLMEEHFDGTGGNVWPQMPGIESAIKDGGYEVKSKRNGFYWSNLAFPVGIEFTEGQDWMLEVTMKNLPSSQPFAQGIIIESLTDLSEMAQIIVYTAMAKDKLKTSLSVEYPGMPRYSEYFNVKDIASKVKIIRQGSKLSYYLNDKLVKKTAYDAVKLKAGKFYFTFIEPYKDGNEGLLQFDDVVFKIL